MADILSLESLIAPTPEQIAKLDKCVKRVRALLPTNRQDRTGGFFARMYIEEPEPGRIHVATTTMQVGAVDPGKVDRYSSFSMEKVRRVAENQLHMSSFQSQDQDRDMWPGAIRLDHPRCIWGFSGFPWMHDEALMLLYAVECHVLSPVSAAYRANLSDNEIFYELCETAPSLRDVRR